MTQPSKVLAAIVRTLREELGQAVAVRTISGQFGADLTDLNTLPAPGVYVAPLRMPSSPRDYDPPATTARFMALCVARDPRPSLQEITRDDVALNLAALVQSIVIGSRFPDGAGEPTMFGAAFNVASVNSFDANLARKGLALWRVEWSQEFELTARDQADTLVKLREIHMTARVGDADTADVAATATTE
jgi:hypothetical protein